MRIKIKKLGLVLLLSVVSVLSVRGAVPLTKALLDSFMERPLYVVLDNNPMSDWNMKVQDAVATFWKLTPYHFINDTQYEQMKNDSDKAFLVRLRVSFPKDPIRSQYNFMSFTLGASAKKESDLPTICFVPLGYQRVDELSWSYKIPAFVRFAQNHIKLIHAQPELINNENPFELYNKNMPDLVNKEVWMVKEDVVKEMRSTSAVGKYFKGKFRFVTKDDIEKAINERRQDVVYLHKMGPEGGSDRARIYKMLLGAGDDKVYYFDYHMVSSKNEDGFLKKDFRRIGRR